jgi:hypothetical protein
MAVLRLELVEICLFHFGASGVVDDVFDGGDVLENVDERRNETGIEKDGVTLCLFEGMAQSFFSEGVVCGDESYGLGCSTCTRELLFRYNMVEYLP